MTRIAPNSRLDSMKATWKPTVRIGTDLVDDQELFEGLSIQETVCPPIESLERRFESSGKTWLAEWLEDDDDPCQNA